MIKLGLFLAAAANFIAFGFFLLRSPTVRFDPRPALDDARDQIAGISTVTPELLRKDMAALQLSKDMAASHIRRAQQISQKLAESNERFEAAFFIFEGINTLVFGGLFVASMFMKKDPDRHRTTAQPCDGANACPLCVYVLHD